MDPETAYLPRVSVSTGAVTMERAWDAPADYPVFWSADLFGVQAVAPGCGCCGGSPWGAEWELGSAAFWVGQARELGEDEARPAAPTDRHRLGESLPEELVACMLGGYGVPGDVGVAAFRAVKRAGVLDRACDGRWDEGELSDGLGEVLAQPMRIPGRARPVRYRFHQQRPQRIAAALSRLATLLLNAGADMTLSAEAGMAASGLMGDVELRDLLMTLPGVGPKTASWVVRNIRASDEVAIIDVHVHRAGIAAGVFCPRWRLPRDYDRFEDAFLSWARAGWVSAADLDALIWGSLARAGRQGHHLLAGPANGRLHDRGAGANPQASAKRSSLGPAAKSGSAHVKSRRRAG